jgi:hypothetical protein
VRFFVLLCFVLFLFVLHLDFYNFFGTVSEVAVSCRSIFIFVGGVFLLVNYILVYVFVINVAGSVFNKARLVDFWRCIF